MGVIQMKKIKPLSAVWTVERFVSQVRTLLNELDNERIQDSNIRGHMNMAISYVAELLNMSGKDVYGVVWKALIDSYRHGYTIDLGIPYMVTTIDRLVYDEEILPYNDPPIEQTWVNEHESAFFDSSTITGRIDRPLGSKGMSVQSNLYLYKTELEYYNLGENKPYKDAVIPSSVLWKINSIAWTYADTRYKNTEFAVEILDQDGELIDIEHKGGDRGGGTTRHVVEVTEGGGKKITIWLKNDLDNESLMENTFGVGSGLHHGIGIGINNAIHASRQEVIKMFSSSKATRFQQVGSTKQPGEYNQMLRHTVIPTGNMQYEDQVLWTHHGDEILLFVGPYITKNVFIQKKKTGDTIFTSPKELLRTEDYSRWGELVDVLYTDMRSEVPFTQIPDYRGIEFHIFAQRQPLLDNMLPPSDIRSSWTEPIDIPDRYMRLVLLMVQKMCLEQLSKQPSPELDQSIGALTAQITKNLVDEVQFEELKRVKKDQGFQTR